MKQSEIQAIQEKLQTIRAGGSTSRQSYTGSTNGSAQTDLASEGDSTTATMRRTQVAPSMVQTINPTEERVEGNGRRSPFRDAIASSGMVELTPNSVAGSSTSVGNPSISSTNTSTRRTSPGDATSTPRQPALNFPSFPETTPHYAPQWQKPLVSSTQLHPLQSPASQRFQHPLREKLDQKVADVLRSLEVQVERINQLSGDQEVAMVELGKLIDRAERDIKAIKKEGELLPDFDPIIPTLNYLASTVPWIEQDERGAFTITSRMVDLSREEREAVFNAQGLRDRVSRTHRSSLGQSKPPMIRKRQNDGYGLLSTLSKWLFAQLSNLGHQATQSSSHRSARTVAASTTVPTPSISLTDAVIWIIGAIFARVGLNTLLVAFPHLWLPVIGMIIAPAAYAAYRATVSPQSGFILGYRLFLIMIGLLLGGRIA